MRKSLWPAILAALMLVAPVLSAGRVAVAAEPSHGIDLANMDLSANPRDDFYRFANGGWLDRTEIPEDKASYGTFTELYDLTTHQLLGLLDEATTGKRTLPASSDEAKAVRIWQQGIDVAARNTDGLKPIQPILDKIAAINDLPAYHAFQRDAMFDGVSGSLPISVSPDLRDSGMNAVYLGGPWLGLPNRDYYLEPGNDDVREAYIATSAKLLERLGTAPDAARAAAQDVYDLEAKLAATTLTREQEQDPELSYNPATVAEIAQRYPLMDWKAYLADIGIPGTDRIIVTQKQYLDQLAPILEQTPIETLRDYLRLQLLWNFSNNLDLGLEQTAFAFSQALGGQATMAPIDERVLGQVNGLMGDALGKLYVAEYFPPEAKAAITDLVDRLIAAFRVRLDHNAWMTPETRQHAVDKLDHLRVKVGYPDKWETYERVEIGDSYAASVMSAANAAIRRQLDKAGKPVDRGEWGMNAQTVNAYYNPLNNEIVFPAAILQPPFFDYQADPASNFGAIGFVIGHEITHGFDLSGSKFDANGNLANWWTPEDRQRFEALNKKLVAQYDAIEVLPGVFVNGQLTVTENAADLGGLDTAYDALQGVLAQQQAQHPGGTPVPLGPVATPVDNAATAMFTPEQRFFIAAATVWRGKIRDEALVTTVRTGTHAPPKVRATQPLRNADAFFSAFDIVAGDPMYLAPDTRVLIW